MTTRTYEEFLLRATGQEVPLYFASFHASEVAKSAVRKSMGTEHELRDCVIYTATLFMRVASCFVNSLFQAYAQDWIDEEVFDYRAQYQPDRAPATAIHNAFTAVKYFGAQVSLQREAAIRDWLVENRAVRITEAMLATLKETFDDATFTAIGGAMTVVIGDDEPRMVVANGSVKFDAPGADDTGPLVLKVRNIDLSESTTGNVHELEVPDDEETTTETISYKVRNVAIWNRNGLDGDGNRVDTEVEGNHINNFLTVSVRTFNSLDDEDNQPAGRAHLTGDNADVFTFLGYNIQVERSVIAKVAE